MKATSSFWVLCSRFTAGIVIVLAAWHGRVLGAGPTSRGDSGAASDSVKIEPYTGPPIFLEEPEKIASAATIVTRDTKRDMYDDKKTVRVERELAVYSDNDFAADGKYREFYPDGKPFVEGQFRKGRQEGEWKYYFNNGQLNRKASFKDGKPDGSWEVHRADGTLSAKRGFKDGLRDGEWTTYDESGKKPLSEEHYIAGEEDGVWKVWFPNGQLRRQASFKKGKRDGVSTEWDEKGQKVAEAQYTDGKFNGTVTRWLPDGKKIEQQYENGRLKSESKQ